MLLVRILIPPLVLKIGKQIHLTIERLNLLFRFRQFRKPVFPMPSAQ